MVIPRAKISFKYRDIIECIFRLLLPLSYSRGEKIIQEFENQFALNYEMPPAVVFNKARMALYFLLKNLNLKPGGEVLISAIHIADFVNIIYWAGFKPVVVDVDSETYCIDYNDLEKKINNNSVLVIITHLSGFVTDMSKIEEISKRRDIPFVEDCSQAVSSDYRGRKLGTFGVAAIFSLSLMKPVCTLFGGMVISQNKKLLELLRQEKEKITFVARFPLLAEGAKHLILKLATQKTIFILFVFPFLRIFSAPLDFFARYQRYNKKVIFKEKIPQDYFSKFTWQQAILGLSQLESLAAREEKKISNAEFLYRRLSGGRNIRKIKLLDGARSSFWTFPVYVEDAANFKKYLAKYGIDSSGYLLSVLGDEPAFAGFDFVNPVASDIKKHTLLISMYSQLTTKELEHMISVINSY